MARLRAQSFTLKKANLHQDIWVNIPIPIYIDGAIPPGQGNGQMLMKKLCLCPDEDLPLKK